MTDFTHDHSPSKESAMSRAGLETWIRSIGYEIAYWLITAVFALVCTLLALVPGRALLGWGLMMYGSAQVAALRWIAGIRIEIRGRDRLPEDPVVIAAKHQSWGDGFVMLSQVARIAFVAGDHLLTYPLVGRILKKAGAVCLSNKGGEAARASLQAGVDQLRKDPRDVLIYPEGHLSAVGEKHAYRSGVWRLYDGLQRPCTPVATTLGLAWDRQSFLKRKGRVVLEFLDPIAPGMDKDSFMAELETRIESRTRVLEAEGR